MRPYHSILNVLFIALVLPGLATADLRERVAEALAVTNPNLSVESISDSPVEGIKEIKLSNGKFIYGSPDSDHVFSGRLMVFSDDTLVDLTERREKEDRAEMLQAVNPGTTITYPANGEEKYEIYVFTDTTCPYCKKFHAHMDEMNQQGITVHYLALPRSGINTPVAHDLAKIWCAEDPQAALDDAFAGQPFTQKVMPCRAPVADQYEMAQTLGVSGTPSVFSPDGRNLGGYMSPKEVIAGIKDTASMN
ncbi:DsbC family protein [Alloalcanivorax gelatiniphagus]|uniref:Thiol:disulfide interchange protein n=1 Tax=Alloalcanivorax gelatiniphagus TaxID=1194167 RepID=A0ABY2XNA2_9GAMM|nr:DsbC family protein [Alloalcanivorax gelatiniphagus]TMW12903.1 DsbC family protein [Alloalcanivorax gelatiniphagus]